MSVHRGGACSWGGAWSHGGSAPGGGAWSGWGLFLGVLCQGDVWSGWMPGPGGGSASGGLLPGCVPGPGGGGIPAGTEADPPGETATAADGIHPTGMHSCLSKEVGVVCFFWVFLDKLYIYMIFLKKIKLIHPPKNICTKHDTKI